MYNVRHTTKALTDGAVRSLPSRATFTVVAPVHVRARGAVLTGVAAAQTFVYI